MGGGGGGVAGGGALPASKRTTKKARGPGVQPPADHRGTRCGSANASHRGGGREVPSCPSSPSCADHAAARQGMLPEGDEVAARRGNDCPISACEGGHPQMSGCPPECGREEQPPARQALGPPADGATRVEDESAAAAGTAVGGAGARRIGTAGRPGAGGRSSKHSCSSGSDAGGVGECGVSGSAAAALATASSSASRGGQGNNSYSKPKLTCCPFVLCAHDRAKLQQRAAAARLKLERLGASLEFSCCFDSDCQVSAAAPLTLVPPVHDLILLYQRIVRKCACFNRQFTRPHESPLQRAVVLPARRGRGRRRRHVECTFRPQLILK